MDRPKIPKYRGPDTAGRTEMMSRDEIRRRFDDESASCYSQREAAWLPEFSYAFDLVPRLIEPFVRDGGSVLDIGAGTGNLSRTVLKSLDRIEVTLVDFSANMLAEVPNVLAAFPGKYRAVTADFMEYEYGSARYSAVISSFAIHHCRGEAQYLDLYRRIRQCLIRPGAFVCCDVVAGDTPELSAMNEGGWAAYLRERGFSADDIAKMLSNYHVEDSPLSMRAHLRLLEQTGFASADVAWKKHNFAVYVGVAE